MKALDIAASFANMWGAELDVISAAPKVQGSDGDKAVMESFMEGSSEVRIKPIEESYPDLKITRTVVPGNAVQALTKASYDHDVVVVGSRGRGGFTGLLLGSTSQGLIQHAVGPVYVVPRKYVEAAESRLERFRARRPMSSRSPWSPSAVLRSCRCRPRSRRSSSRSISAIDPEHKA